MTFKVGDRVVADNTTILGVGRTHDGRSLSGVVIRVRESFDSDDIYTVAVYFDGDLYPIPCTQFDLIRGGV